VSHKRNEGRDEPVLAPDLPIVDAHMHLFDGRPTPRYMLPDYLADVAAGHRIVASVYVETSAFSRTAGPELLRPLGEIEFANGVGAMADSGVYGNCRVCAGIVAHADFTLGDDVAQYFDRALQVAPDRLRGIRQVTIEDPSGAFFRYISMARPREGIMRHPNFRGAFRHLAPRGLSFDAAVIHAQLPELASLADAFPLTTIVLNHMGTALGVDQDEDGLASIFREWRDRLRNVARRPNVVCKVGGLGMAQWGLGFDRRTDPVGYLELARAWQPYVETALEAFGPDRCMMESNFPPDGRSCGFVPLWNALKHIVRDCTPDEQRALFSGTAARVYRLDVG
jgi:predicted TIM-barrel fold metal-dependent hydrolase